MKITIVVRAKLRSDQKKNIHIYIYFKVRMRLCFNTKTYALTDSADFCISFVFLRAYYNADCSRYRYTIYVKRKS